jgi:hypothetical protein
MSARAWGKCCFIDRRSQRCPKHQRNTTAGTEVDMSGDAPDLAARAHAGAHQGAAL